MRGNPKYESTWKAEAGDRCEFKASVGYIARPCLTKKEEKYNKSTWTHVQWPEYYFAIFEQWL